MNELMDGAGDAAEQEMINVTHLLAEAGVGIKDVTKATVFVTDRAYLPGVTDVVLLHPGDAAPRLTTLIIKGLASLDLFMKVDITAVVPGGGS